LKLSTTAHNLQHQNGREILSGKTVIFKEQNMYSPV